MNAAAAFERVRAELSGNPRVRVGAWVILGVVVFYGVLVRSDHAAETYDEYVAGTDRLTRAQAVLARTDWPQLIESELAVGGLWEGLLWEAETEGLARATLEEAIRKMVADFDLDRVQIRAMVTQPVNEVPGVWKVQARLQARCSSGAALAVLYAIAAHPRKLVVDSLDLVQDRSNRISLLLSAYFVGIQAEPD